MGRRMLALVLAAVLCVGLLPAGTALGFVPTRTIEADYPLVSEVGGQIQPDIDWPYVAYKDGRYDWLGIGDSEPHIRVYNMETGRDFQVSPDNMGLWEQSNPSISGKKVVYSDQRNYDDTNCDVWMYDIATGMESVVCDAPNGQGNPFIHGDTVVWVDRRNTGTNGGHTEIWMKDLVSTEETAVSSVHTAGQYEPVVWEDYVVWRDQRHDMDSVYLFDTASGEETCVAEGYYADSYPYVWDTYSDPFVYDGVVVYQHRAYLHNGTSFYYEYSIEMYDIESGTTETLSTTTTGNRWHPVIRDGWVTWSDARNGNTEVWGYDLIAGQEVCLVPLNQDGNGSYAGRSTTGDGWILWHDHRSGDNDDSSADLYARYLGEGTPASQAMPLQGGDRFKTAVDVSQQAFPIGADSLVICTGRNWPDALAGASLAGAYDAPILLVGDTLPAAVAAEIERLGPDQTFILGGTKAIPSPVESAVASIVGTDTITRLAGDTRYETACIVASETVNALGSDWDGTAFATTGRNWPDALAASPLAAWAGYPVFLAGPDGFDAQTQDCMSDLGVTGAVVLGGTVAMPLSVLAQVESLGVVEVDRVGGETRYETAALIAEYGVTELGMSYDTVGIATGANFPDALSAGAALGSDGYVMLLTPATSLNTITKTALEAHADEISQVRYIGGPAALSVGVRSAIEACIY